MRASVVAMVCSGVCGCVGVWMCGRVRVRVRIMVVLLLWLTVYGWVGGRIDKELVVGVFMGMM